MRRIIKVLAVTALVATILVVSISPVLARPVRGGVLLPTTTPCTAGLGSQNVPGSPLILDPPGRAPGCWVELPSGETPGG
ncbi:MAG TPA: hypothetical protein VFI90_09145 [Rubrobacter sp.]|nr:hypothetical protein [Rubrobacter sp.]